MGQLSLTGLPGQQPDTFETDEAYTIDTKDYPVISMVQKLYGGKIGLDPTANPQKTIPAKHHMTKKDNSLELSWKGLGTVYMNPPYSCADLFVDKLIAEYSLGHVPEAVSLLLATTVCTKKLGHRVARSASAQCWIWGRLSFRYGATERKGEKGRQLTVPSVLTYWGDKPDEFCKVFCEMGTCSIITTRHKLPRKLGQLQKRLLFIIKKHGSINHLELAKIMGCHRGSVINATKSLEERGFIDATEMKITEAGLIVALAMEAKTTESAS